MKKCAKLTSRSAISISGPDRVGFLQNLITCDVEGLSKDSTAFGALLTPQGKILFDFLIHHSGNSFLIDLRSEQAEDFAKRLTFYRLRAAVDIERLNDDIIVSWPDDAATQYLDPRIKELGARTIKKMETNATESEWEQDRINAGIPQCGSDFLPGDVFPHEALMDQFGHNGVDFSKGCYVGQEVVSRMQHRGTARSRFVKVSSRKGSELPVLGSEIEAGGRKIGKMGCHIAHSGLALLRLDRAINAIENGIEITAGNVPIKATLPDFVDFDWPQ